MRLPCCSCCESKLSLMRWSSLSFWNYLRCEYPLTTLMIFLNLLFLMRAVVSLMLGRNNLGCGISVLSRCLWCYFIIGFDNRIDIYNWTIRLCDKSVKSSTITSTSLWWSETVLWVSHHCCFVLLITSSTKTIWSRSELISDSNPSTSTTKLWRCRSGTLLDRKDLEP